MSEVNWVNHKRVLELIFILDPEKTTSCNNKLHLNFIFTIIFSLVQSGQSFNVPNVLTRTLRSQKWPSSTCRCWRPKNQHTRCPAETSAVLGTDTPPRHTQHQCGATVCFLHLYEKFKLIIIIIIIFKGTRKVDHIRNESQNLQTGPSSGKLSNAHTPVVPKVRQSWKK